MRKTLYIVSMLLFSAMSYAQVELLHTFTTPRSLSISFPEIEIPSFFSFPSNCYYYPENNSDAFVTTYYYYNADFTLERTESHDFSIVRTVPAELQELTSEGYSYYYHTNLSNHLINTDDYFEYLVYLRGGGPQYAYIINSQGELISDLGNIARGSVSFHNANGQVRMRITYDGDQGGSYCEYNLIYSCGGNATRITENSNINKKASDAYPNPATEYVNIPYELNEGETATIKIYDVNGKQIDQKQIGFHFNNIKLDVSNYRPGTYIYEYNGKANRFIVQ